MLAQEVGAPATDRLKIGLVLSGGAAKGIAHIGVLKVFEEAGIPIDVISGASMGAIAGGLYSIGFRAKQLEAIVNDPDWQQTLGNAVRSRDQNLMSKVSSQGVLIALPTEGAEFRIPSGVISGQEIIMLLANWTWPFHEVVDLTQLPIPLAVIATDLKTGQAVSLKGVPLSTALRASMSIPTLFAPVDISGTTYIDGGVSRNLPAVDAIQLGADILIGVDVSSQVDDQNFDDPTLIDVLMRTASYLGYQSDKEQRALLDVLIRPDISDLSITDFEYAEEWVRRGETAARAALPRIEQLLDSLGIARSTRPYSLPKPESKFVTNLEIQAGIEEAAILVEQRLGLVFPVLLGPNEVASAVSNVYFTGLFDLVTYEFRPDSDSTHTLVIEAQPRKTPDRAGLGVRYDSENAAQLLFSFALRNRLRFGSITELRVSVGKQKQVQALYMTTNTGDRKFNLGFGLDYSEAPIQFFLPDPYAESIDVDPNVPVLSLGLHVFSSSLLAGYAVAPSTTLALKIKAERVLVQREVASVSTDPNVLDPLPTNNKDHSVLTASFDIERNTFDDRSFPMSGMQLVISGGLGLSSAEPNVSVSARRDRHGFQFFRLDLHGFVPLTSNISGFARTSLGYGSGEALPLSYHTFIGGTRPSNVLPGIFLPVYGLETQARFGRKAYLGSVGFQWEVLEDVYSRFFANAGGTFDILVDNEKSRLPAEISELLAEPASVGLGLEIGVRTPIGPAALIFSSKNMSHWPEMSISVGYSF